MLAARRPSTTAIGARQCWGSLNNTDLARYLLTTLLRDTWNFTQDWNFVVGDCGAVRQIFTAQHYNNSAEAAATASASEPSFVFRFPNVQSFVLPALNFFCLGSTASLLLKATPSATYSFSSVLLPGCTVMNSGRIFWARG